MYFVAPIRPAAASCINPLATAYIHLSTNEKRRYAMTLGFRQYIAGYTVANLWRYPIRRRVAFASALELWIFSYPSILTFVLGAQKNRLIETVLLSTHNICSGWEIRKISFNYTLLSRGLLYSWINAQLSSPLMYGSDHIIYFLERLVLWE